MLRRIDRLQNSGIFQNFRWNSNVAEFDNVTIIYGPNGSGKTSLSNALLRAVENIDERTKLDLAVGDAQRSRPVETSDTFFERLFVFNDSFVADNHRLSNQEATTPAIVTVGKRTVDALAELKSLRAELPGLDAEKSRIVEAIESNESDQLSLRKRVSARVVDDLTKLGGEYQSRSHFSASKVAQIFMQAEQTWMTLSELDYQHARENVASVPGDRIEVNDFILAEYDQLSESARLLLAASPSAIVLESLASNPEAEDWVSQGQKIHAGQDNCIFCGNSLSNERRQQIDAHFSSEVIRVIEDALTFADSLESMRTELASRQRELPARSEFDVDLRERFDFEFNAISAAAAELDGWAADLAERLRLKSRNVVGHVDSEIVTEPPKVSTEAFMDLVKIHNDRINSHGNLRAGAASRIRDHHFATESEAHDRLTKQIATSRTELAETSLKIQVSRERIQDLQSIDGSIAPSAERLTREVRRLLGREELSFRTVAANRYEIRRHDDPAHGLSEGERTAITLVHFLESIRVHDSAAKGKPVVIVDDPVSSLDQRIFIGASSALWAMATSSDSSISQIILLTHNFELFRQWDIQWERFPNKRTPKNPNGLGFSSFELKSRYLEKIRTVELTDWPENPAIRKKTRSTYHQSFIALVEAQNLLVRNDSLENRLEAQLLLPNVIRGVLETFLAFKIPEHMGSLAQLMAKSQTILEQNGYSGDSNSLRHNLLRYSNAYSHSESPQTEHLVEPDEILAAINSLFIFMNAIDRPHFLGMCTVINVPENDVLPT